jgi:hypothetical protein
VPSRIDPLRTSPGVTPPTYPDGGARCAIRIGTFRTLAAATVAWSIKAYISLRDQKGQTMEGSWTYSLWGAAAGAATLAIVGFTWGGWVTGGQAEAMTMKRSEAAVVAALTPVCIERFQGNANASTNLVALKNISQSWSRRDYIVSGGWATFGKGRPFELAEACAEALNKL